ncbi:unnamed protein product [Ranitomeya imitator]|uniref:Transposase Tc1-like domain-containing protein n=1 Tax=Ranitomeya imitator TaxID=111125 RepID=A0ABN9M3W8_9NEOB|nr:unnamed protein product [Ranitomeya imitator]
MSVSPIRCDLTFPMISVERVMEYTQLEKEAAWESKKRPPPGWPSKGMIAFENVSFAYSLDGPLVLRHLTALIRPKEKVGIVGRTGAGKSSLIAALFRLAEPEGKIWIDKILTSDLGLHDLRKGMSIIPQARSGRPRKTSERQRRRMVRSVKDNPQTTSRELQHQLAADDVTVHRSTIQHTLHKEKLYGRVMRKKPFLQARHKQSAEVCKSTFGEANFFLEEGPVD